MASSRARGSLRRLARLEHGRQGVALDQVAGVADGPGLAAAGGGGGEVADPGLGHDQDPAPGQMGPPAQVEVVAEGRHALVEAADVQQGPAPDQHPGGVDEEHVVDLVVLALVDLVVLDLGHGPARPVDREADLRQPVGVGPGDQLGAEDGRARAGLGLGQEPLEGLRLGGAVVMEQPQPVHPRGAGIAQGRHHRPAELPPNGHDGVVAQAGAGPVRAAVRRAGVDHQHVVDRAGLGGEAAEGVAKERASIVVDDDRDDPWLTRWHNLPLEASPAGGSRGCIERPVGFTAPPRASRNASTGPPGRPKATRKWRESGVDRNLPR